MALASGRAVPAMLMAGWLAACLIGPMGGYLGCDEREG
jgi:hypothetical protein